MFQRNGRRSPLGAMLANVGERVREKMPYGIKQALALSEKARSKEGRTELKQQSKVAGWKWADNTMRAVSAGMGIADVRAMFRGDPPIEKPNPRYKVFTNGFVAHIRPRYYEKSSTKFTHTFGLGYLSAWSFLIETITGLILMVWYIPEQTYAYNSMIQIMTEIPFGQLMRDIHRVGAEVMVIAVALHMLRVYTTGSYKHPRQFTWVTGVILLILTWGLSYSGYLLPWDQLSYWAVTIGTSMAKSAPPKEIMGYITNVLLRGGDAIAQNGLLRFYLLHVILLPLLAIIFISVHYYRVARLHGISLPAGEEEHPDPAVRKAAKERLDYLPEVLTKELLWFAILNFAIIAYSVWVFHAPLEHHADPLRTPLHTTAPWYFLWLQGMLKDPWLLPILRGIDTFLPIDLVKDYYDSPMWQGVLLPTVIIVAFFAVPYIDEYWDKFWNRQPSRQGKNRKLGLAVVWSAFFLAVLYSYFGTPFYGVSAPPAVEVGQKFMPEECVLPAIPLIPDDCGAVRRMGYAKLPNGTYDLAQYATKNSNAFDQMLAEMQQRVEHEAKIARDTGNNSGLPNVKGVFIVEDWQTDLKKVTLSLKWTPTRAGDTGEYDRIIFLHKKSHYE